MAKGEGQGARSGKSPELKSSAERLRFWREYVLLGVRRPLGDAALRRLLEKAQERGELTARQAARLAQGSLCGEDGDVARAGELGT
jgi:hypothetical protein